MIYIFTHKWGIYIAFCIQYLLRQLDIPSEIIFEVKVHVSDLHIILFSQKVKQFPKNYIIYQLEQKDISSWIDKKYLMSIAYSIVTWDYSQSNIVKFDKELQKKMYYFPIPIVPYSLLYPHMKVREPWIDVLFYGNMNEKRREKWKYLEKHISKKYKIMKLSNTFGYELFRYIESSKIVLNIHFYEGAILETCRINEIMSCHKLVISERPSSIDSINEKMYEDRVIFIENGEDMVNKIVYYLENKKEYEKKIRENEIWIHEHMKKSQEKLSQLLTMRNT